MIKSSVLSIAEVDYKNPTITMQVYLPDGYEESSNKYPVLYMLHGAGSTEDSWTVRGGIQVTAAQLYWTLNSYQPKDIEYRVIDGDHDWMVFRDSSIRALPYISQKCEASAK